MSKDLAQFDSLKADITIFVAPVTSIKVSDFKSSADAIEAGKQIKALMKQVEDKRKDLVGPLNDQVKLINDYAKNIREPLETAEQHVKVQLAQFATEQEKIRQEELRRAEEDRRAQERRAEEERQRISAEIEAKKQAELEELRTNQDEAAALFGDSETEAAIEEQSKEIELAAERERLEAEAALEREAVIRNAQARQQNWDINQNKIKGTRQNLKVEVVDIDKVPVQYLIRQLNESMAKAAHKGGMKEIPGLRFYFETSVSLGSKTYVPRRALEGA